MKRNKLTGLLLNVAIIVTILPAATFAQQTDRTLKKMSWRTEPIRILKVKTKNKNVELGQRFSDDDDWLNGLALSVQNISNKAIARIELSLAFPPPKGSAADKPYLIIPMGFGREPDTSPTAEVQELVLPGEKVEIKLPAANFSTINTGLKQLGYPEKITQAEISVKSVTFVDGSEWSGDEMLYPDPNNPKKKINPIRQKPESPGGPYNQSNVVLKPAVFRFLNVGIRRAHALPRRSNVRSYSTNNFAQLDDTLPCDKIFLRRDSTSCGPVGEGLYS